MRIVDESSATLGNVTLNGDCPTAVPNCEVQIVQKGQDISVKHVLAARQGSDVPHGSVARATILFVEDEEGLRTAVASMLRKKDFNVLEAADGTSAIDLLRANGEISALILDVCLPGLPSKDVLEEARRIQPAIPVIVASAFSQNTAESSFEGLHVDCFIRKPYRLAVLMELLETLLPAL